MQGRGKTDYTVLANFLINLGVQKLGEKVSWLHFETLFNAILITLFVALALLLVMISFVKIFTIAMALIIGLFRGAGKIVPKFITG